MRSSVVLLSLLVLVLQCPTEGEATNANSLFGFGVRLLTRTKYRIDALLRRRKEDVVSAVTVSSWQFRNWFQTSIFHIFSHFRL